MSRFNSSIIYNEKPLHENETDKSKKKNSHIRLNFETRFNYFMTEAIII